MSESDFNLITQHIKNLNSRIRRSDGDLLFNYKVHRRPYKKRDLSLYFVERLLYKLQIQKGIIDKCIKAPLSSISKILELTHLMVKGKTSYMRLAELKTLLCEELRVIPQKLNDPFIFNDVRGYIERHVKN